MRVWPISMCAPITLAASSITLRLLQRLLSTPHTTHNDFLTIQNEMFNYTVFGLCARPSIYLILHTIIIIAVVVVVCSSPAAHSESFPFYLIFSFFFFFSRSQFIVSMSIDHDSFSQNKKRILSLGQSSTLAQLLLDVVASHDKTSYDTHVIVEHFL